jgi:hypothetical protein
MELAREVAGFQLPVVQFQHLLSDRIVLNFRTIFLLTQK